MNKRLYYVLTVLLCAAAALLFLYTTPFGVGLTNDSAAYFGGARSILAGRGYVRVGGDGLPRPITHFPPFYSIVLAAVSRVTGADVQIAAKWVNLCCTVLNQALFMVVLFALCGSCMTAFLGGIIFLCAGPVLQANVYGLSEALFLTLFLPVLLLSVRASRERKTGLWLLIGLLAGALSLTRYAGLAAVGALIIFILCVLPSTNERFRSLGLFLIGFGVPFGTWMLKNAGSGNSTVNRVISLHLPAPDKVEEGIRNIAEFFLPEFGGFVERFLKIWGILIAGGTILLLAAVIIAGLRAFLKPSDKLASSPLFAPALHAAAYMAMLVINVCFIDGSTLFDNRILLPFYVCIMLLIGAFCARFMTKKASAVLSVLFLLGFAALLFEDEWDLIREYHRNGQGMAGEEWTESAMRLAAKDLPSDKLLFSNRQTALYLLNDQPSFILPPMFDAASFSERESFEQDRAWMDDEVLSGNAYVVVFNYQDMMENEEDRQWLDTVLEGLPVFAEYSDGAIFGLN